MLALSAPLPNNTRRRGAPRAETLTLAAADAVWGHALRDPRPLRAASLRRLLQALDEGGRRHRYDIRV